MRAVRLASGTLVASTLAACTVLGPQQEPPSAPFEAEPPVMARLTAAQYRNTLTDLFGEGLPLTQLEQDTNPYLFYSIGAASTSLSELGAQQYADAAAAITDWVFADPARRDALITCSPTTDGDTCKSFVRDIGQRLYRRPLSIDELERWVAVARDVPADDPYRGLRMALFGMLQSPSFLYRIELGEPDPEDPSRLRYTSWEMAQRLSFLLWNTSPDSELLSAAERGDLQTEQGLREHAQRLLESPRARAAVQDFFGQYFDVGTLAHVERAPGRFPQFSGTLAGSMTTELRLLVDDLVFRRDADLRELFSTRRTYVNAELAALYGVDAPGATELAFVPVELPADGPRAGILTLGAFLTMNAHYTETSPTLRGKFVRERILCQRVLPPPPEVDVNLEDTGDAPTTLRERLEQHRTDPFCAGCHSFIDPPGFLFESFDSVGAYRTEDQHGYELDTSGDLDGIPLANARELGELLATDGRVAACLVQQLYRHANARLDAPGEQGVLRELGYGFARSGYRFQDLLVELVASRGFRFIADGEVTQ